MSESKHHLAFLGATGGCALAALTLSLKAGHTCSALVRTPSKLSALLSAADIPADTLAAHLTIHAGSIDDRAAVLSTLTGATTVICGVGGSPALSPNPLTLFITLNDPTICERAVKMVIEVLAELGTKPFLCVISSTGLDEKRDIPLAMVPLYKVLEVPHRDKKKMEEAVVAAGEVLGGWVVTRPALLTDGAAMGEKAVRAGYSGRKAGGKWGGNEGVAVGYTVSRKDVGAWIFEEVVEGNGGEWRGKMVSLAY